MSRRRRIGALYSKKEAELKRAAAPASAPPSPPKPAAGQAAAGGDVKSKAWSVESDILDLREHLRFLTEQVMAEKMEYTDEFNQIGGVYACHPDQHCSDEEIMARRAKAGGAGAGGGSGAGSSGAADEEIAALPSMDSMGNGVGGGAAAAGPTDWGPTSDIIALRQRLRELTNKVMAGDESCMEEFDKIGDVYAAHPDQVRGDVSG